MTTYLLTEIRRNFRQPRFLVFVVAFPVLMFLLQANVFIKADAPEHAQFAAVIMINMMTFGTFAAANTSGGRLALERALGWQRQLRLTPLTGTGYLAGKGLSGMLVGLPALILVPLLAVTVEGVHLDAAGWIRIFAGVWLGTLPLVLLGLLIGQFGTPETMQPISMIVTLGMGFLGGLWIPLEGMPAWMHDVAQIMPTYWVLQVARPAVTSDMVVSLPTAVGVLAAWTVVLGALVIRRYRKDSARV
ncbi:ABC-2 type transport system permease protein [Amycolatopsis pretoriensis]|uniref:Transport permease protein n=2 Tax=Amycolatopsis pretoriensis TaxID=218821 RepID=A0A1H5R5Y1_9PSEU|nr:ABC transporter permease [Amycolatopsis pretoriensis]SEF32797.1 ABC-2 type transport system permease protein [Amycolatopsis pretoriensis]